jgi:hypothetical protein
MVSRSALLLVDDIFGPGKTWTVESDTDLAPTFCHCTLYHSYYRRTACSYQLPLVDTFKGYATYQSKFRPSSTLIGRTILPLKICNHHG